MSDEVTHFCSRRHNSLILPSEMGLCITLYHPKRLVKKGLGHDFPLGVCLSLFSFNDSQTSSQGRTDITNNFALRNIY